MNAVRTLLTSFVILILLGIAAWQLGQAGLLAAKAWSAPILIESAWNKSQKTGQEQLPWPWADGGPIAKISAPRLQIQRYVLKGDNMRNLAFGPVLQKDEAGSVMFGHRDTHFRFLQDLRHGDAVVVDYHNEGPQTWSVTRQAVVAADNLYKMSSQDNTVLMFITCYPFSGLDPSTDQRYVVWLEQM